jgi:hypothetical protein
VDLADVAEKHPDGERQGDKLIREDQPACCAASSNTAGNSGGNKDRRLFWLAAAEHAGHIGDGGTIQFISHEQVLWGQMAAATVAAVHNWC